jgi:formamidase
VSRLTRSTCEVPDRSDRCASLLRSGTAPSQELLDTWNKRETALESTNLDKCCPKAHLPLAKGTYVGSSSELSSEVYNKIAAEGARTIPPREHGGNCDIKNLSRGSRCYFPVYVDEAKLSLGDLHFSQGDGELTFCGAIEMVRPSFQGARCGDGWGKS